MIDLDSNLFAWLARRVLGPTAFLGAAQETLSLVHEPSAERRWEVYLGHLLAAHQTRFTSRLETWGVTWPSRDAASNTAGNELDSSASASSPTPLRIALVWNQSEREFHVVRTVRVQGWEPFEESPGVISSRWATQWRSELVGTIDLTNRGSLDVSLDQLESELTRLVELAVTGTSRLPITSAESPLPEFALGELAYFPESTATAPAASDLSAVVASRSAARPWLATWQRGCDSRDLRTDQPAARGLEFALRTVAPADVPELAARVCGAWTADEFIRRWRRLFQQISLAPHTTLLERTVELLRDLAAPNRLGSVIVADTVSYMLRHLVRHLTAYDLVTFHSFGANYPDALWLDDLLKLYLELLERDPSLASSADSATSPELARAARLRRRALRQAWLARLRYEGHRVPEHPTSQGERLRVLGESDATQPDVELRDPQLRPRALFADDPLDRRATGDIGRLLAAAFSDLAHDSELRELGVGTFADRPLGIFKESGEVDRTPFLSYEGSSVARRRERLELARARGYVTLAQVEAWEPRIASCAGSGWPVERLPGTPRPGVIMLEDARLASADFLIHRTTASSLREWSELPSGLSDAQHDLLRTWADSPTPRLLLRTSGPRDAARGQPLLMAYDESMQPLVAWIVQRPAPGQPVYREAFGIEYLAAGLRTEIV